MNRIYIHPTSIVETNKIGEGTYIGPFCYISKRVIIGSNCKIIGHVSIGNPAQFKTPPKDLCNPIVISDHTEIREFASISTPIENLTKIGKGCYLMSNCHISHDCILEDNVVISIGSSLSGYTKIGKYCYLGLNSSTHQYAELGSYSILGANSFFKGKSPLGIVWGGVPARPIKVNLFNIKKNVDKSKQLDIINKAELFIAKVKS